MDNKSDLGSHVGADQQNKQLSTVLCKMDGAFPIPPQQPIVMEERKDVKDDVTEVSMLICCS